MSQSECPWCELTVSLEDNYCARCGGALPKSTESEAISATAISHPAATSSPNPLLPAVRADLAPFVPVLRSAASVIATAALADWAARHALPVLADKVADTARELVSPKPRPAARTILVEEHITIRQRISVQS